MKNGSVLFHFLKPMEIYALTDLLLLESNFPSGYHKCMTIQSLICDSWLEGFEVFQFVVYSKPGSKEKAFDVAYK